MANTTFVPSLPIDFFCKTSVFRSYEGLRPESSTSSCRQRRQQPRDATVTVQAVQAGFQTSTGVEALIDGSKTIELKRNENLRFGLQREKVDLYTMTGKVMNCGGYGNCGLCIVDITEGSENCSPKTPAEQKKLGKKPPTWRMACQTLVSGPVKITTRPQTKK